MPVVTAHGEIEAELIAGRLRDEGLDARIVRDGKQSPGAWMHAGHDPIEPMTVMVPEDEVEAAREALEERTDPGPRDAGSVTPDAERGSEAGILQKLGRSLTLFRWAVVVVVLVLIVSLLEAQLIDVLPFLGEP